MEVTHYKALCGLSQHGTVVQRGTTEVNAQQTSGGTMPIQAVVRVWPPDTTILWPLVQISWLRAQWCCTKGQGQRGLVQTPWGQQYNLHRGFTSSRSSWCEPAQCRYHGDLSLRHTHHGGTAPWYEHAERIMEVQLHSTVTLKRNSPIQSSQRFNPRWPPGYTQQCN